MAARLGRAGGLHQRGETSVGAFAGCSRERLPGCGSAGSDYHPGAGGHRAQGDLVGQVEPTGQDQPDWLQVQHRYAQRFVVICGFGVVAG